MIRFCEIFNLHLKIYYSTAEWSDDDHDFDYDFVNADELYSHAEIIDQCDFRQVISLILMYTQTLCTCLIRMWEAI